MNSNIKGVIGICPLVIRFSARDHKRSPTSAALPNIKSQLAHESSTSWYFNHCLLKAYLSTNVKFVESSDSISSRVFVSITFSATHVAFFPSVITEVIFV